MNSDLNHIIEQCKSENRASQRELYFLTIAKFKLVLRRYCKETNDAQDIIQSTYLRIFECIYQFDAQKGDFYHWANRILINEFFKLMRSRKKVIMLPDESIDEEYSLQFNWNKFTLEEVQQVIKSMNETQSILLHLYYIEQYNFAELSALYNMKESSIRGNISRARKAFELIWNNKFNHQVY